FKLRGSFGQSGNDRIDDYQYLATYGIGRALHNTNYGYADMYVFNRDYQVASLSELRIPSPTVTWEVAQQSNIGVDISILDGKLAVSADYFYNFRNNILEYRNASIPT